MKVKTIMDNKAEQNNSALRALLDECIQTGFVRGAERTLGMLAERKALEKWEYEYYIAFIDIVDGGLRNLINAEYELKKIIKEAPKDSKIKSNAYYLLAQVYGLLGDIDSFCSIAIEEIDTELNTAQVYYCFQLLCKALDRKYFIENTDEFKKLDKCIKRLKTIYGKVTFSCELRSLDGFFLLRNTLSVLAEYYDYLSIYKSIDSPDTPGNLPNAEPKNQDESDELQIYLKIPEVIRYGYRLGITFDDITESHYYFFKAIELIKECNSNLADEIVAQFTDPFKYDETFPERLSKAAYEQYLLKVYDTIYDDKDFIDFFFELKEDLIESKQISFYTELLYKAYYRALNCNSDKLEEISNELEEAYGKIPDWYKKDIMVFNKLSKESQILYKSAYNNYMNATSSENYGCMDAGMLSLGFFRVIELEFKKQLIINIFKDNSDFTDAVNRMRSCYPPRANNNKYTINFPDIIDSNAPTIKTLNFSYSIGCIENSSDKPLTLEKMDVILYFLSEECAVDSDMQSYVDDIRKSFYDRLSEKGKEAAKKDEIRKYITTKQRSYFRNPPAHAVYLPLYKAEEFLEYVDNVITKLHTEWLKQSDTE